MARKRQSEAPNNSNEKLKITREDIWKVIMDCQKENRADLRAVEINITGQIQALSSAFAASQLELSKQAVINKTRLDGIDVRLDDIIKDSETLHEDVKWLEHRDINTGVVGALSAIVAAVVGVFVRPQ